MENFHLAGNLWPNREIYGQNALFLTESMVRGFGGVATLAPWSTGFIGVKGGHPQVASLRVSPQGLPGKV